MWTGVLLGILFMIYGRVQQPAAAVSASQAHFMEQMKTFQLGAMRRDVWTGRMWFRGMRLPVALLWSTLINLFIIEMRQEGRKELCIWSHIISSSIFPIKCMWCRGRWRPGFPRQTISLLDRYWTSRRRRRHFIRIKWIALEPVIGLTLK